MTPEQMTNEGLDEDLRGIANALLFTHNKKDADIVDEAARRLRNSIPEPVVEVVQRDAGHDYCYSVSLNGVFLVTLDSHDTNQFSAEDECRAIAKTIRQALGMEGGGDE